MKNISILFLLILGLSSCFETLDKTYDTDTVVEFSETVTLTPSAGKTYPLISVVNGVGERKSRVNLVGKQRSTDINVKFSVDKDNTTATEGTHFKLSNGGIVTVPANSSFGDCTIEILKAPAQAGKTVNVVLTLDGDGGDVKPNENYKKIGFAIKL
jgi:hypothetical protein